MGTEEVLKQAMVEAMRAKDQVKLDAVRQASSAIHYREIEKRARLDEKEVFAVLATLCKQRRESMEQFEKGGRTDLVNKEKRELEILASFLPQPLSEAEIRDKARQMIESLGVQSRTEMGKVMKPLMQELAGRAEGSVVSRIVNELLK